MYKVLLIDDEAVILQGLRTLIDWEALGVRIVGEARDGEEGMQQLEACMPDLVISDVAMPRCSGIDLLRRIHEMELRVKVILLSGYQEFSYAQEAVRHGAVDYLLKPVSPEELERVIRQTVQQIREEERIHKLPKNDSPAELFFQDAVMGKKDGRNLEDFKEFLSMDFIPGAVCVAVRLIQRSSVNIEENKNLIRFEIYEYIRSWIDKQKAGVVVRKEYNSCFFLLFMREDREKIKKWCTLFSRQISEKYAVDMIIGTGAWTDGTGKLNYLYRTAKFAVELYYFTEKRYIGYEEISKEYRHSLEEYQECMKKVRQQIAVDPQSPSVLEGIEECVDLLGTIHYGNKNVVINNVILLAGEIYNTLRECGLTEKNDRQEQEIFLEDLRRRATFSSMKSTVKDYYSRIFLKLRLLGSRRESAEILRIKQYIQDHYNENITLEELADHIGMNPSYMSVFFKKETGQNYKNYLTEIRMKEALKLLNSTNMKSYELARAVGYRDEKQFREKFREYYGMSPQKYKKRGSF